MLAHITHLVSRLLGGGGGGGIPAVFSRKRFVSSGSWMPRLVVALFEWWLPPFTYKTRS